MYQLLSSNSTQNLSKVQFIFSAKLNIIGINAFVFLPVDVLTAILRQAGKEKGKIPVKGTINGQIYRQTLVKYSNEWRLYINQKMLKGSPKRIGEEIYITISVDDYDRRLAQHPKFTMALQQNKEAASVFQCLRPSLQLEIIRYLSFLKSEQSLDRNVDRAILFLLGKTNFIGRQKPE